MFIAISGAGFYMWYIISHLMQCEIGPFCVSCQSECILGNEAWNTIESFFVCFVNTSIDHCLSAISA